MSVSEVSKASLQLELRVCAGLQKLVFAQKMGRAMSDVPILSSQFNTWFPLTLVIWCTILYAPQLQHAC